MTSPLSIISLFPKELTKFKFATSFLKHIKYTHSVNRLTFKRTSIINPPLGIRNYTVYKKINLNLIKSGLQRTLCTTTSRKRDINVDDITQFIIENTEISTNHLTPEIKLHLITPNCCLWHGNGDECKVDDPFWAFYWPGGQALTRYILDHPSLVKDKLVLDVGSGCGASAIAAAICGANHVVANDICNVAAQAIKMNAKLNRADINVSTNNYIGTSCTQYDVILLGDMFYDVEFTNTVSDWVKTLHSQSKLILIGDPGRFAFKETISLGNNLDMVGSYDLPQQAKEENNGLSVGYVWMFK